MEIFSHVLLILCAIGGAASVVALAAVLVSDEAWARWKNARKSSRAIFAAAAILAALYGGTKQAGSRVSYPRTDSGTAYLTDAGSVVTNDAVILNFTRASLVPDEAWLYLDACPLSVTNSADVAANCVTVYSNQFSAIALPLTVPYADATNYQWFAYTDWTPGPVVHTNGVVNVAWLKAKGEMPPNALRVVPLRTDMEVVNAETEEERAYRIYAPDTAILIDLSLIQTNTVTFLPAVYGSGSSPYGNRVHIWWGDGEESVGTASGWGDTAFSHTYKDQGRYVIRIADTVRIPWSSAKANSWPAKAVVRILRWGDGVNHDGAQGTGAGGAVNLQDPLPRWGKGFTGAKSVYSGCTSLKGPLPAWPDTMTCADWCYYGCTSLECDIPAWGPKMTKVDWCYYGCKNLTGAWTDDAALLMPTNITTYGYCFYVASAAVRALFYPDWGGSRAKPADE